VFLAWVLFPLVLALSCAGWGLACRNLLGIELDGALMLPFGFAAVVVAAGLLTASATIAPATVTVIAVVAVLGLARNASRIRPDRWAVALGVAVLLAFGAPVILSGQATFTGYIRLDDTATWLSIVDRVLGHSRSLASLPPSTYALNLHAYLSGMGYPLGAFLPLGVGRALVGVDAAWVFQPFLAFCGAMIGLVVYAASRPIIGKAGVRAVVAFLAAQPALLYGYALWGGIKELVAAVLLALLAAFVALALTRGAGRRALAGGLAIVAAALAGTLGPGAAAWLAPALGVVVAAWLWRAYRASHLRPALLDTSLLAGATAVLMLPVWVELSAFINGNSELFGNSGATSSSGAGGLVSLYHPLSVFQLGGVWPVGDFRLTAPTAATVPLLVAVALGLGAAARLSGLRRQPAIAVYPAIALLACLIVWLGGSNPWVIAKALAIGSPALPAAALVGVAALAQQQRQRARTRFPALVLLAVIGGGVVWSNVLGYHDATLAPRARLAELQQLAPLLARHGPTLINEYEVYADRHFLRDGSPTEPAEYRPYQLPLANGTLLTQSAQADLDALSFPTILGFPSIVTRTSPVQSRPSSIYKLRFNGRYYELWQRPLHPASTILEHIPFGDSSSHPFCGQSTTGYEPLCSIAPAAPAPCPLIRSLARRAAAEHAELVAFQRPAPIVASADQTQWPGSWLHDPAARTLSPTTPGDLVAQIAVASAQRYALWLGGSFARGFEVSVDGRDLGRVKDQLANIGQYVEVARLHLPPGVHKVVLRYPHSDLTPGSGAEMTQLAAIALQPLDTPATTMLTVSPQQATTLCGRELDWVEIVRPA
jgi:hypothetical protein